MTTNDTGSRERAVEGKYARLPRLAPAGGDQFKPPTVSLFRDILQTEGNRQQNSCCRHMRAPPPWHRNITHDPSPKFECWTGFELRVTLYVRVMTGISHMGCSLSRAGGAPCLLSHHKGARPPQLKISTCPSSSEGSTRRKG